MSAIAVLANATAGKGRHAHLLGDVLQVLGADAAVLSARTAEEAQRECEAAVAGGARAVVAVGGDGTLHSAVQAVAGSGVPLGIVPAGNGDDNTAPPGG